MVCKVKITDVFSKLKSWKETSDDREAITKDFKFLDFTFCLMKSIDFKFFFLQTLVPSHGVS